ncbi:hypothetical protein [Desulfovibrio litoralis]|uniref:Uncharacterized protein n=1 Tax=Desulfovibrio litoralis DSM 11393 TaxID=1121455 RepID=A0A1M7RTI4_9BACT|nr:hypothetical protein [Desulfovibrio litoralis]SHN49398.1 hypothetical protein SAMN02745728_00129 [Desulfovibrio litoralis DSM 11393]
MIDGINDPTDLIVASDRNMLNAKIITQTLDTLNSNTYNTKSANNTLSSTNSSIRESYLFQKDVLSAAYDTKGFFVNNDS